MQVDTERLQELEEQWLRVKPGKWKDKKHRREREFLYQVLRLGEEIVGAISGSFRLGDQGFSSSMSGLLVATSRRVLFLRNKISDVADMYVLRLTDIESFAHKTGRLSAEVRFVALDPHEDFRMTDVDPKESAQHFGASIEQLFALRQQMQDSPESEQPLSHEESLIEQWWQARPSAWDPGKNRNERQYLFGIIPAGEEIAAVASGMLLSDGHQLNRKEGLIVATTHRLLFLKNGVSAPNEIAESVLETVDSASFNSGLFLGEIAIGACQPLKGIQVINVAPKESAERFANVLENLVDGNPKLQISRVLESAQIATATHQLLRLTESNDTPSADKHELEQDYAESESEPDEPNGPAEQWLRAKPDVWGDGKHRREREILFESFGADEEIVAVADGHLRCDEHQLDGKEGLLVATSKRVLFLRNKLSDPAEIAEAGFDTIESTTFKLGWMLGEVALSAREPHIGIRVINVSPKDSAEMFATALDKLLTEQSEMNLLGTEDEELAEDNQLLPRREVVEEEPAEAQEYESESPVVAAPLSLRDWRQDQWARLAPGGWGEGKHLPERDMLFGFLSPSESIVAAASGRLRCDEHRLDGKQGLLVSTSMRVLFLKNELSDPGEIAETGLDTIESTAFKLGFLLGEVTLLGREPHIGIRMVSVDPKESAENFANEMDTLIAENPQNRIISNDDPGQEGKFPLFRVRSASETLANNSRARITEQWLDSMPGGPTGWGEGKFKGEREMLIAMVDDDEDVQAVLGGTFRADTGRVSPHQGVVVATTKRVIFLDKGILGNTEVMEIGYRNIESITYSTGMMRGGIQITGRGAASYRIEDISPRESNRPFADCVRRLIDETREQDLAPRQNVSVPQTSSVDELQKLADLLQDGHLTAEEFATMKAKIIERH